jgi:hypothetical protein
MINKFLQDDWTKAFCLIFNDLVEKGAIQKKKYFSELVGLQAQANLNHILLERRDFPLKHRQQAMEVLRSKYHINLDFFRDRKASMYLTTHYLENEVPDDYGSKKNKSGGMTYSEILKSKKVEQENEYLKKLLEEKDIVISTQAALIKALQENISNKK